MIELRNLSFAYGKGRNAISDANGTINPGIHLLLGENGAGKTTLLHILAGLRFAQSGECLIDGSDVRCRLPSTMRNLFFVPDNTELLTRTINGMKKIHACFYPNFSAELLEDNLRQFGMTGDERFNNLSLGDRNKTLAAYALSLQTELLLLDEPANGLDINSKKTLRRMIASNCSESQTIIVSTHTVWDLKALFDGLLVMNHGRLLLSRSTEEISRRLCFITSAMPVTDAIYQEQEAGIYRAIVRNTGNEETEVDFNLVYSALMSEFAKEIINTIIKQD